MNRPDIPLTRELVLIGGGHAHALLLRRWGMRPLAGARLTVINPDPAAPYTGMLPGHVAGHYDRDALDIDLVRLARFAGARIVLGAADRIDRDLRRIHVEGRGWIGYDLASIDIGITSDPLDVPGFAEHAIAAKPLGPFARAWRERIDGGGPQDIAVLGGGVGGVELAMAMAHALRARSIDSRVTVIEMADTPLSGLSDRSRDRLLTAAAGLGVTVLTDASVAGVTPACVTLSDGRNIASRFTVGVTGARPHDWLKHTGLHLTDGFVTVDPQLRSISDPSIFAVGDCAHVAHAPRPKAGVYAVRAAPVLAHNLRATLSGATKLQRFDPQRDYLKLISMGRKAALLDKWGVTISGGWVWRWKDSIDRRFMDRLNRLPPMPAPPLPRDRAADVAEAMGDGQNLCGGCGAKVGAAPLGRVLGSLPALHRDDLLSGLGDDAAVLSVGGTRQVLTTDHLRAFTADPGLMAQIAAVHALGDVWAMGAVPQAALAQITLPRMNERLSEGWLAEIMGAAQEVFAAEGAAIAGGHTTQGAELTIGFTVTGLLDGPAITVAGAQAGDALILTRPIGSGVLLAGEMTGKAQGRDIARLWSVMATPQGAAARCLYKAHAMTDVTGFGLAGHLYAMMEASGFGAILRLADIPLHHGAAALAAKGVRSTLHEQNRQALAGRIDLSEASGPAAELLFDPQTSGGFLAAVPAKDAARIIDDLAGAGVQAATIGSVTEGPVWITVT